MVRRRSSCHDRSSGQEAQAQDAKAASSSCAAARATASHHSGDANVYAYAMPGICGRIAAPDAATWLLPATCLILLYDTYGTYSHMYPVVYVYSMYVTGDNIVL